MEDNIYVIISSVIYFKEKKLSYSSVRSIFSPEERLAQTKKTISSVREKMPFAKILLVEQGINNEVLAQLKPLVDLYCYIGDNKFVRSASDSIFKGLGEAVGLLCVSKYLPKEKFRAIKISGRYYLNDNFNLSSWTSGKFIFLKRSGWISTRLYSFASSVKNLWRLSLILSLPLLLLNISIEKTMTIFIPSRMIKNLDKLGLQGYIGVGEQSEEFSE